MKTAVKRIAAYELDCPECGGGIPAPDNGSFMWIPGAYFERTATCPDCNATLRLPDVVRSKLKEPA
jgi:hypothetical protein